MRVGTLEIQILAGLARLQKDMNDAMRMVGGAMGNVERSVASAKRAMQTLGVGLPLVAIVDQVRRMTDQYTKLDAQIRLATKSNAQYAQGLSDIRRISSVAQADISATSMLYTRLMNVMDGTGVSQQKLATVTETVAYGLKAYGATTQEAASAALQLSQAMGANRLGGEEFRAVMEAMPNVMKVVADSMSKSEGRQILLGDLRQLSIEGKITADVLINALGDPAIAAQFKKLAESTQTVTGAWQVARNELMLLVGEFSKSSGTTNVFIASFNAMGEVFALLAKSMQSLVFIAGGYVAFLVTKLVVGTALAIEKSIAHTEALAMNAAGIRAAAAATAQASVAETAALTAAAAAKQAEVVATREALFATEADILAKIASTRSTIAQAHATNASTVGIIQANRAKQAAAAATLELAAAEAALATIEKARNSAHVQALAMDAVRTRELKALAEANKALAAAEAARNASMLTGLVAIGAAMRAAILAHPLLAAAAAITAIVLAIANWKEIVDTSKASFTWFMDEFIGGLRFGASMVRIMIGEMVQKMALLANLTWPDLKSGEFKRRWDKLGAIAEQSKIDAAARLRGIDKESLDKEKLAAAVRAAQDRDAWDKLHATKQQQRAAEIAELDTMYAKMAGAQGLSQSEQLRLAEEYRTKLGGINAKYSKQDVKAFEVAQKKLAAQEAERLATLQEYMKGIGDETQALLDQVAAQEDELARMGLTEAQLVALTQARYDEQIALKVAEADRLRGIVGREAEVSLIEQQIDALGRLKKVAGDKLRKREELKAVAEQRKAYEDMWKSIDTAAHDTWTRVWTEGRDAFTNIGKTIKSAILDMLYQMTVKKWIIGVSGIGGSVGAGSAFAGGDTAGGMNMPFGGSSMLGSGISWLGNAVGSAGMSTFGTGMGLSAAQAAAASSAYSAAGMSSIASSLSAGSMIGTALPWIGGALAIGSALGLFGGGGSPAVGKGYRAVGQFGPDGISGAGYSLSSNGSTNFQDYAGALTPGGNIRGVSEALAQFEQTRAAFAQSAHLLGIKDAAAKLATVTVPFDVTVGMGNGLLPAMQQAAIDAADALAKALVPNLADFAQANESLAQTFQRLTYEAQSAAGQLSNAWQSLTDAIFAEVARIRGLTATASGSSAQFATLTAQARAGDENAAKLLPGVARAMLDVAAMTASNATDLARIQGRTSASLETTGMALASKYGLTIPAFATGTAEVPVDMVAQIHKGERITPKAFVDEDKAAREETNALLRKLQADIADVKLTNRRMWEIEDKHDVEGMPEVRTS